MQKFQDVVLDSQGRPVAGAVIAVQAYPGGAPATVYETDAVGAAYTPTTDSFGAFFFYAPNGTYSYTVTFAGAIRRTVTDITLFDPADSGASSNVGYLPAGTGAVATTVQAKLRQYVSVKDFGAVGDGVTNDTANINEAIAAVNAAGGGTVFCPSGAYLVDNAGGSIGISLLSKVMLRGAGVGATVLKLKNAANAHLINVADGTTDVAIMDMTLDGNRANQSTGVHCFRVAGASGLLMQNLEIQEAYQYGVGIQGGTNKNIRLINLDIHDTGGDGIDIKNLNDDNEDIHVSNVSVRSWGNNGALTVQAAIDLRGPVRLNNIWVSNPVQADAVGVRFRQGELLDVNGLGAHRASISDFDIRMGVGATQIGVNVVARDVMLCNGYVTGGLRGVLVQDSGFHATNVVVEATSSDGFLLDALGSGLDADDSVLVNCTAFSCGADGFDIEADDCQLVGCFAYSNNQGVRIQGTADATQIIGGRFENNTASQIGDLGTNSIFVNPVGFTSSSFQNGHFRVSGAATPADRVLVAGGTGAALLTAEGSSADVDVVLIGKGASGIRLRDGAAADKVRINTTGVGFNNVTPIARPTISGSRGGNAALANLLTQLANYGLITDSTTA